MRIIHLIDPSSPGGGACALAELAAIQRHAGTGRHQAVILGARRHEELARRCGVEVAARLAVPAHLPTVARNRVRQHFHSIDPYHDRVEAVIAWTPRSAWLAANAAPRIPLLMRFSLGPVGRFDAAVLHWSLTGARVPMLAASETVADAWARREFNPADAVIVPSGVDASWLQDAPRNVVRRRWKDEFGIGDDTFIVGLIGEPVSWPDARMAVEIVARVALSGRRVRLALHHAAARRVEAVTLLKRLDMTDLAIEIDELAEPWRVMNGLDAALALGVDFRAIGNAIRSAPLVSRANTSRRVEPSHLRRPYPSIAPMLWACAAGVPVVAHDLPTLRGIIEHGTTGLLVSEHDMNGASDNIARLYDDSALRSSISAAAIDMVSDRFVPQALCDHMEQACEDAANEQALRMSG